MKHLILLFLLLGGTTAAQAQFLKKLENAAKRAAEQTIEDRVEQGTRKTVNKTIDKGVDGAQRDTTSSDTPSMNPFGGGSAKAASEYHFDIKVVMEMTQPKEDPMTLVQRTSETAVMTEMPQAGAKSIMDLENNVTVTIMEEQKTAMIMSNKWAGKVAEQAAEQAEEEQGEYSVVETGRTRDILGYHCKEYHIKDNKSGEYSEVWMTDEIDSAYARSQQGVWESLKMEAPVNQTAATGMLMEMTHFDKKGKQDFQLRVLEYAEEEHTLEMNDYSVMAF